MKPDDEDENIPRHQQELAQNERSSSGEDSTAISEFPPTKTPLDLFIRLTSNTSSPLAQHRNEPIGARILYAGFALEMRQAVYESARLRALMDATALRWTGPPPSATDWNSKALHARWLLRLRKNQLRVQTQVKSVLYSLVTGLSSARLVGWMGVGMERLLVSMYHQGIHIKQSQFQLLLKYANQAQQQRTSLIFLPCHKSHVDYLVISWVFWKLGIALPHIAAGDNLNLPGVGWVLKQGGAFFIRRSFSGESLYGECVKEYMEVLLERGHNLEVFIEGTRSRTGKLLNPKFGLLKVVLDAVLSGRVKDVILVPMSIDYDRVIETETYVNELLGRPKQRESLVGVLNSGANVVSGLKLGRIDIRFAKPFHLNEFIHDEIKRRSAPDSLFSPLGSVEERNVIIRALGYRVLSDINGVSVIQPTSLVGTVLLTLRGRGVGQDELCRRVMWLRREIILKGGHVAYFAREDVPQIVLKAVRVLSSLVGVRKELAEPVYYVEKRFELSLFRNQVMHLFLGESVIAAAMYATIKKGQTHRRIPIATLRRDVIFLSQLLKKEFIFRPGGIDENLARSLYVLIDHGVVELEDYRGETMELRKEDQERTEWLFEEVFVKLTDEERLNGRESFDFYNFLIWPFIESYWLAAVGLFCIIPAPALNTPVASTGADGQPQQIRGVAERVLMDRVQHFGKTLYYEGDLGYFESINRITLKNAFNRYQEMGIIIQRQYPIANAKSPPQQQQPGGEEERMGVVYAVSPEYEDEAVSFMRDPKHVYASVYEFQQRPTSNNTHSIQPHPPTIPIVSTRNVNDENLVGVPVPGGRSRRRGTIYGTRLWDFVEEVGKFRREGKHRRDNEVTGKRTLTLASLVRQAQQHHGVAGAVKL